MDKKCPECKAGAPEYMLTYGDLVTLLMCFFVLLFAMSSTDAQKFEALMVSFQGSAGILPGGTSMSEASMQFEGMPEKNTSVSSEVQLDSMEKLKEEIQNQLNKNNLGSSVDLNIEARGLVIRFPDNVLFDSGSAIIKGDALPSLKAIGGILVEKDYAQSFIRVEGHTDNVPISTSQFPSNWELSTARSTNVIKYMINNTQISPDRLSASGYGEYKPIANNNDASGRSKNRRVDIVVLKSLEATTEPSSTTGQN